MINENILFLLHLSNEVQCSLYSDMINCLGLQLTTLTKDLVWGRERSVSYIQSILRLYCNLEENETADKIRRKLEKILVTDMRRYAAGMYSIFFNEAWTKFDKIPHQDIDEDLHYFKELKDNVIVPLGLDPQKI